MALLDDFSSIKFGFASAEHEAATSPELLAAGFYDYGGVASRLLEEHRFVVLGRKGSGKSALGLHLQLLADDSPTRFVTIADAAALSLQQIAALDGPAAGLGWQWVLLLLLISSAAKDQSLRRGKPALGEVFRLLESQGLLVPEALPRVMRRVTTRKFRDPLLRAFELSNEPVKTDTRHDIIGALLIERLRETLVTSRAENPHTVIIDGLDQIDVGLRANRLILSDLFRAASVLNRSFFASDLPFRVILLRRSDVFDRIPLTDKNKIRQDDAVELNWSSPAGLSDRSPLGSLVNQRAALSLGRIVAVGRDFLSFRLQNRVVHRLLVDYTRWTPRDIVMLLERVKAAAVAGGKLSGRSVAVGITDYARDYFHHELVDELNTFMPEGAAAAGLSVLRDFGLRTFTLSEFLASAEISGARPAHGLRSSDVDLFRFINVLYESGGLGQLIQSRYRFEYYDQSSPLRHDRSMQVHPALSSALELQ